MKKSPSAREDADMQEQAWGKEIAAIKRQIDRKHRWSVRLLVGLALLYAVGADACIVINELTTNTIDGFLNGLMLNGLSVWMLVLARKSELSHKEFTVSDEAMTKVFAFMKDVGTMYDNGFAQLSRARAALEKHRDRPWES